MKKPCMSCQRTPHRKVSIELDGMQLKLTWMAAWITEKGLNADLKEHRDNAEQAWRRFWVELKKLPSYTIRVNGRAIIKNHRIVNKKIRARVAKWAATAAQQTM